MQLLLKLTDQKCLFAGDTAQAIVKGVNAKIEDFKNIFPGQEIKPDFVPLTVNYRSHNQILDLANSVVTLVEIIFPRSIDKMNKEVSTRDGLKPIILQPMPDETLRQFFFGAQTEDSL